MDSLVGMLTTGALPIVMIGSGIGTLFAVRNERRPLAVALGILFVLSLAAMAWVYFFVFTAQ